MKKKTDKKKRLFILIPIIILSLGIIIRLLFTGYFGVRQTYSDFTGVQTYTHDTIEHSQYIQYVAAHLSLPEVNRGLEYPQQPLYYLIAGFSYRILSLFLSSSDKIFRVLIWFSSIFSIGSLIFVYFTAKKIAKPVWLQSFIVGLFAFTPAFVFQSIMISNDPLLTFLASGAFFFLISYIEKEKHSYLVAAIIFSVLSVLTKISGGLLLILILFALIYKYWHKNSKYILIMAYSVFLIGFLCLGATLYRSYIPSVNEFRFVESYTYQGQKTDPARFSYFFNFNFAELEKEGQSYVFGNENVARTFPTFLYGSFIFGEYDYSNLVQAWPAAKMLMRLIILLGLIFPFGIIANLFFIKKWSLVEWVSGLGAAITLWLIISFLYKYSSVCNSDFRYFSPIFSGLLLLCGMGLYRFTEKFNKYKLIIPVLCIALVSLELIWIIIRISLKIPTTL
jgi:4-amino-4-deoxy-L-arabinose transferase-like glycosyltransferase